MPQVSIPGVGIVNFPDDMSQDEITLAIERDILPKLESPETGAAASIKRGAASLATQLTDTFPGMIQEKLGFDEAAAANYRQAEIEQARIAAKYPHEAGVRGVEDVKSVGDAYILARDFILENLPLMGATMIPGIGGAAWGARLSSASASAVARLMAEKGLTQAAAERVALAAAKDIGRKVGGAAGAATVYYPTAAAESYQGLEDPDAAFTAGAIKTAIGIIPEATLLSNVLGGVPRAIAERAILKRVLGEAGKYMAAEGVTEGAEEAVDIAAEHIMDKNPEIFSRENLLRTINATVAGALSGGVMGGVGGAFMRATPSQEEMIDAELRQVHGDKVMENITGTLALPKPTAVAGEDFVMGEITRPGAVETPRFEAVETTVKHGTVDRKAVQLVDRTTNTVLETKLLSPKNEEKTATDLSYMRDRAAFLNEQEVRQPRGLVDETTGQQGQVATGLVGTRVSYEELAALANRGNGEARYVVEQMAAKDPSLGADMGRTFSRSELIENFGLPAETIEKFFDKQATGLGPHPRVAAALQEYEEAKAELAAAKKAQAEAKKVPKAERNVIKEQLEAAAERYRTSNENLKKVREIVKPTPEGIVQGVGPAGAEGSATLPQLMQLHGVDHLDVSTPQQIYDVRNNLNDLIDKWTTKGDMTDTEGKPVDPATARQIIATKKSLDNLINHPTFQRMLQNQPNVSWKNVPADTPLEMRRRSGQPNVRIASADEEEVTKKLRNEAAKFVGAERAKKWSFADLPKGVLGQVYNDLVHISRTLLDRPQHYMWTVWHEGWHLAEFTGIVTKEEMATLDQNADELRGIINQATKAGWRQESGILTSELDKKHELRAYAGEAYGYLRDNKKAIAGTRGVVRRIFEKVYQFIKNIAAWGKGSGKRTVEKIYESYFGGEMSRRANVVSTALQQANSLEGEAEITKFGSMKYLKQRFQTVGVPLYRGERPAGQRPSDPGDFGVGEYWTSKESQAKASGKPTREIIKLKNPAMLPVSMAYDLADSFGTVSGPNRAKGAVELTEHMRRSGFDGLVAKDRDGHIEVVVFPNYANDAIAPRKGFSLSAEYAGWTPQRLSRAIGDSAGIGDNHNKTNGMVGWVDPLEFVWATAVNAEDVKRLAQEAGNLDLERLSWEDQTPFLKVNDIKQIVGHEGRHRMAALAKAGFVSVPVHFIYEARLERAPITAEVLDGQTYQMRQDRFERGTSLFVRNMIPLTRGYEAELNSRMLNTTKFSKTAADSFVEISDQQRGKPAQAARLIADNIPNGRVARAFIDVSEIAGRLNDHAKFGNPGTVGTLLNSALRALEGDFALAFREELKKSGLKLHNVTQKLLPNYLNTHSALPAYSRPQWLARSAAEALGNMQWDAAVEHLRELNRMTQSSNWREVYWAHHNMEPYSPGRHHMGYSKEPVTPKELAVEIEHTKRLIENARRFSPDDVPDYLARLEWLENELSSVKFSMEADSMFSNKPKNISLIQQASDIVKSLLGVRPHEGDYIWAPLRWFSDLTNIASTNKTVATFHLAAEKLRKMRHTLEAEQVGILSPYATLSETSRGRVFAFAVVLRAKHLKVSGNTIKNDTKVDMTNFRIGETMTLSEREMQGLNAIAEWTTWKSNKMLDIYANKLPPEHASLLRDPEGRKKLRKIIEGLEEQFKANKASMSSDEKEAALRLIDHYNQAIDAIDVARNWAHRVYVPLARFGTHGLSVRDKEGKVVFFRTYNIQGLDRLSETRRMKEDEEIARRIYNKGHKVGTTVLTLDRIKNIAPNFLETMDALSTLVPESNKAVWGEMRRLYKENFDKIGKPSFMRTAEMVPGFDEDGSRALFSGLRYFSNWLANVAHKEDIGKAVSMAKDPTTRRYLDNLNEYISSPQEEHQGLRQLGFMYMLTDLAAAAVNTFQLTFAVLHNNMYAPITKVVPEYGKAINVLSTMLGNSDFRENIQKHGLLFEPEKLFALFPDVPQLREAYERGDLFPGRTAEAIGLSEYGTLGFGSVRKLGAQWTTYFSSLFATTEVINRVSTYVATIRTLKKNPEYVQKAVETLRKNEVFAKRMADAKNLDAAALSDIIATTAVDETQFIYAKNTRPAFMRGIGSVMFQFSQYWISMIGSLIRPLLLGQYGNEGRWMATKFGIALVLSAGVWGFPMADDLKKLIELIYRLYASERINLDAEAQKMITKALGGEGSNTWHSRVAEFALKGMFRSAGVDMSRRLGMGQAPIFGDILDVLAGRGTLSSVGPPVASALTDFINAFASASRNDIFHAFAKTPWPNKQLRDALMAAAWRVEGVRTNDGNMVLPTESLNLLELMSRAAGFNPTEVARKREADYAQRVKTNPAEELRNLYYDRLAREDAKLIKAAQKGNNAAIARAQENINSIYEDIRRHNADVKPDEATRIIKIDRNTRKENLKKELGQTREKLAPKKQRYTLTEASYYPS